MRTPGFSEDEALRASDQSLLAAGKHRGVIAEASDGVSAKGNETMRLVVVVDDKGKEYRLVDWLSNTALGALKTRHAAAAVGALVDFEAGEISAEQFMGREVLVTIQIERKRGFAPRSIVVDYAPAAERVVNLRAAAGRE